MTQSNSSPAPSGAAQASHQELSNAIRALSMDAVQAANSGHPGMPMGMADVATVLFSEFLNFDPKHPKWPNRDRFVLSAGHGSMLLYSLLYLTGYEDISLDDIKNFRQLGSKTAGHPEYGHIAGIETTTGPLGQGLGNAVGMALAERLANARYGDAITNHYTYAITGDGCLMEGISHEAASMAGHLKLNKLIVLWDDNGITIDGAVDLSSSDDMQGRFEAYQWNVLKCDGHDAADIRKAISAAQQSDRPTLIACKTTIGYGSPNKAGTSGSHGSPLGDDEIKLTRAELGWPHAAFEVPQHILNGWRGIGARGGISYAQWTKGYDASAEDTRKAFERGITGELGDSWQPALEKLKKDIIAADTSEATRKSSQNALEVLNAHIPMLIGGSADLTGSNNTKTGNLEVITPPACGSTSNLTHPARGGGKGGDDATKSDSQEPPLPGATLPPSPPQAGGIGYTGRYMYYGIREHGMAAVMNGLALYGGFIPYGGTFLVFADYCRPSIRLSALMEQRAIYVMTHDSIGLGEDGPTHQPIEHLASLRAIPNLNVFRPADAVETAECWALALTTQKTPSILALSRQNLPNLATAERKGNPCAKGGYVVFPSPFGRGVRGEGSATDSTQPIVPHPSPLPKGEGVTLIATGSEVSLAIETAKLLEASGIATRVVSMPCTELFDAQPASYREEVLGRGLRVSIEAACTYGWAKYTGLDGLNIGIDSFGASGPAPDVYKHFGLTADVIAAKVKNKLG